MAVVYCEEVGVVAQVFQHAAGVLALLFFWAGAHETGDVHLDSLEGVDLVLDAVGPLVLLFLLFTLACAEDAEKIHRNI